MIDRADIEQILDVCISRKEFTEFCNNLQSQTSSQNERLAKIEIQVKIIMWLVGVVAAAIIPMMLNTFK